MTLHVSTTVGEFTRRSETPYTHVNVWASPRARAAIEGDGGRLSGVYARWVKDRGFGVTWHKSEASARNAAAGRYGWDPAATLVGTFPVEAA